MAEKLFPRHYKIIVEGYLNEQWRHWLGGMSINFTPTGETVLTGQIADQSALYGILNRLRDLGMTLVSVESLENEPNNKSS